jgi:glycosyltransferase involved in cell wall biosynthesis
MVERILALDYWIAKQPPSNLKISVIIPTRSRPALVSEAIASVQAQSHSHWEVIVVDDGSEDETREVLAAISDERVRSLRAEGVGPPGARAAGLDAATGDVIAYLDDDNIMLPGWLASVAWAFSQFEDVDVLYGARVVEDETPLGSDARLPRLLFRAFDRSQLLEDNYIDASVIAHRAELAQARWDRDLAGIADWDLILRLTEEKPALALPLPAVLYRTQAPDRLSGSQTASDATERLRARMSAGRPG